MRLLSICVLAPLLLLVGCAGAPEPAPTQARPALSPPLEWLAEVRREAAGWGPRLYLRARTKLGLGAPMPQDWLDDAAYDPETNELVVGVHVEDVETNPFGVIPVWPVRLRVSELIALEGWDDPNVDEAAIIWPNFLP